MRPEGAKRWVLPGLHQSYTQSFVTLHQDWQDGDETRAVKEQWHYWPSCHEVLHYAHSRLHGKTEPCEYSRLVMQDGCGLFAKGRWEHFFLWVCEKAHWHADWQQSGKERLKLWAGTPAHGTVLRNYKGEILAAHIHKHEQLDQDNGKDEQTFINQ